ncbi:MAG: anhydro-N-acetylmuramic acid kinase, partial [Bacteroidales bacterium]|nr:anhydro-N-acetylmuramic acid kinase [Bacteroidales bacterium]
MSDFYAIGLMSGTSVDGLDVVLCRFCNNDGKWSYSVLKSQTYDYDAGTRSRLLNAHTLSAEELRCLDVEFGRLSAGFVNDFRKGLDAKIDLIASHGHTVFHNPSKAYTLQIGDGNVIAKLTGLTTVYDFRSGDVALGGQGAPLVPIGDELLFPDYDACLNIGGFSNVSMKNESGTRIAFDISPANIILNEYARNLGMPYDDGGRVAASGSVVSPLLDALNNLEYYTQKPPKSLGRE